MIHESECRNYTKKCSASVNSFFSLPQIKGRLFKDSNSSAVFRGDFSELFLNALPAFSAVPAILTGDLLHEDGVQPSTVWYTVCVICLMVSSIGNTGGILYHQYFESCV